MSDTKWLDVILNGRLVQINSKGEIRKVSKRKNKKMYTGKTNV